MNILVNQCKFPGISDECFCLSWSKDLRSSFANNDNVNDNVNDNDLRSSFANNVNDNDNDKDNDSVKYNVNDKDNDLRSSFTNNDNDNVNDNDNDNANDLRSSFAKNVNDNDNDLRSSFAKNENVNDNDLRSSFGNNVNDNDDVNDNVNDNFIYLFYEKHQRVKPNNKEYPRTDSVCGKPSGFTDLSNNISVNINDDPQSWLSDDNITTEATLSEKFRCIISGPSECGKTFSLKKLILAKLYFDKLYIISPTGDQNEGVESYNRRSRNAIDNKADVEFGKDIKDLSSPDQLPKDLKKLMIFNEVRAKEPVINEYFCRGRRNNCNMIYLNQNLFTIDRQSVRENCNLFILF